MGLVAGSSIRIVPQHERIVRFRLGRVGSVPCGPGIVIALPFIDRVEHVSLRTTALPVEADGSRTGDGRVVDAAVVVYYRIDDPIRHVTTMDGGATALMPLTEGALRDELARSPLAVVTAEADGLRDHLRALLAAHASAWGMEILLVEIQAIAVGVEPGIADVDRPQRIAVGNGSASTSTTRREQAAARP